MKKHLPDPVYQSILATYPDGNPENIWNALFRMGGLFSEFAKKVAGSLGFDYNLTEELHVRKYLEQIHEKKEIPGSSQ